jgi:serine/threonine protein kinase
MISCKKTLPTIWVLNSSLREFEINREELKIGKKLNTGHFGEVYIGHWRNYNVAIKSMKSGTMTADAFLREAEIMKEYRHVRYKFDYSIELLIH